METRTYRYCRTSNRLRVLWFVGLFVLSQIGFWHSIFRSDRGGIVICATMGLVFAGFALLGLRLSSSRACLILGSEGLQAASSGLPLIPWGDVKALYRRDLTTHSVVQIILMPAHKYERLAPKWRLSRIPLERTPEGPAVSVLITSLDAPADQVCQEIQQGLQDFRSRTANKYLQPTPR